MTCDCVQDEIAVVRRMNKTLRTMNGLLREKLRIVQEHTDAIFMAWCEMDDKRIESFDGGLPEDDIGNQVTGRLP
jgi:hypothetical protein